MNTILYIIVAIIVFNYLLGRVLDYLNDKNRSVTLPAELAGIYDEEKYKKSQQYHKEKSRVSLISETLSFVIILIFIFIKGFGLLSNYMESYIHSPIWLALAYFGVLMGAGYIISLPFGLYDTFVLEQKYGFNKTSPKTYILDTLKSLLLVLVLGCTLGYFLLWLILELKQSFWVYAWVVASVFSLLLNMFYSSLIVPIFNKLSPLQEGELKRKIQEYAAKVNFPLTNVFVIDGSKRSTKGNAFFSGIGKKKKIVLYDTLIANHTEDELVSVLAHEVGHFKKKHIIIGLVFSILQMGLTLFIMSWFIFNKDLSLALGADSWKLHINLIAFGMLYEPIGLVIGIFMNILSRKNEYEADAWAVQTADKKAFKAALLKLSVDNLSNLQPHPAYVFFHYSHPPVLARIRAMEGE